MNKYVEYLKINEDLTFPIKSPYSDMGKVEELNVELKGNNCYFLVDEMIKEKNEEFTMSVAYNLDGEYIGDESTAKMLCEKGIYPEPITKGKICQIGFNKEEQKWYGWSHRAIYGFGIGSKVKIGDIGFKPKNKTEFLESLKKWYEDDDMYNELEFTKMKNGIKVHYCIYPKGVKVNESQFFVETNSVNSILRDDVIDLFESDSNCTNHIEKYPSKWGKGEWTAKTLDDAKQMAIDFAENIS